MNTAEVKEMVLYICEKEIRSKEELCRLDSFVGDGDHGYTVERGFQAVRDTVMKKEYHSPKEVFEDMGDVLAESMGGAIGLIIGTLFSGGVLELDDKPKMDKADFSEFFNTGLGEIKMIGGAKEGDKTLIDALSPAAEEFQKAVREGRDMKECFRLAAKAAREGSDSTKDMISKKGRSKFLQEKSRGYIDAGSVTMAVIIEAMRDYVENLEEAA